TVHSTYVLPGAMLTCGFLAALVAERRGRDAFVLGAVTLLATAPIVLFVVQRFRPTSPEVLATAQDIIVNVRIPHHSRVDLWLDPIAGLQIAWIVLGIVLAWRTRVSIALGVPLALSAALTITQAATGSLTLAMLFPWRISAILVPLATAIVAFRVV